ncbi:MAG: UDP-N-acetylmuramoyl-tripeptide--D-alanyl-D-alanine ligase [bacterium]|nr:UDP-N-acetylmuramoyl-tripeptide--D-alanyl-D-alanine ligase [bacterium]
MEPIRIDDVLKATYGHACGIAANMKISGISTDSRTVKRGDLFVALKGNRVDGHSFVKNALKRGAVCAIVEPHFKVQSAKCKMQVIVVENSLQALGDLATYYRSLFSIPIIGITGSNGKTTSKELTALCLSTRYHVLKSKHSFNSLIGLPLTLFNLSKAYELGVFEMGTNQPGEIERLTSIAKPRIGVITNIAPTHLTGFKTIECVLHEKLKILTVVDTIILNADDPFLFKVNTDKNVFKFGIKHGDLRAKIINSINGIEFEVMRVNFKLPLFGIYNVYNALVALSVGLQFGIDLKEMSESLSKVRALPHREKIIDINGIRLIDSTYNANPVSMKLALEELKKYSSSRRIAILGDMLELGSDAYKFHRMIGKSLEKFGIDVIIGVGDLAQGYVEASGLKDRFHFSYLSQAKACECKVIIKFLKGFIRSGDIILVKGSRAMGMEKIVKEIICTGKINSKY